MILYESPERSEYWNAAVQRTGRPECGKHIVFAVFHRMNDIVLISIPKSIMRNVIMSYAVYLKPTCREGTLCRFDKILNLENIIRNLLI